MNPIQLWWQMVRFRPVTYILMSILYTGYTLSLAFSGLILQAFFNRLSGEAGALALWIIVLLQLGNTLMAVAGLGGANATGFYRFWPSIRALIFSNVFARILAQPGAQPLPVQSSEGDEMSVGVALNTLRDDTEQNNYFQLELNDFFAFGLTAIVAFIAMIRISVPITLGVFIPLIVIVLISSRMSERIETYREKSRAATARATGTIAEIFSAVQTVQVNRAEQRMVAHFRRLNEARRQTNVQDQMLTRLVDALAENMTVIGTALVLLLSAHSMQAGRFTVGDFALFVAYIWPITALFRNIGGLIVLYQQSGISIKRLQTLMQSNDPTELAEPNPIYLTRPLPPLPSSATDIEEPLETLTIRDLSYQYPCSSNGIHDINLQIRRGTLTVIMGEIGSGKTTLLRVLLGLLPMDSGEIHWNGTAVDDLASFFIPPRCAYTPQTPRLFSESLRNNILMGLPEDGKLDAAIRQAALEPDLAAMEEGLATMVGPRGMRLSGGQVQRAAAARMFVRQPELLVFDDLSSALDLETERLLWERLFEQETQETAVVVSHRNALLQRADQVVVLQGGRIARMDGQSKR